MEQKVCHHLANRGWTEILFDVRIARVQIDIIGRSPLGILTIVEVKSNASGWAFLSWRQRRRLLRAASVLAQCEPIEVNLALVSAEGCQLLPVEG